MINQCINVNRWWKPHSDVLYKISKCGTLHAFHDALKYSRGEHWTLSVVSIMFLQWRMENDISYVVDPVDSYNKNKITTDTFIKLI